jgi:aspartate-semialdehyde dehydrogenase
MKTGKMVRLALLGTDSLRGKEIKNVLSKKNFPLKNIDFYDPDVKEEFSKLTQFKGEPKVIRSLNPDFLSETDLAFLASEKKINRDFGESAVKKNIHIIDLSETFNEEKNIPLVVAGVNDSVLKKEKTTVVANPHPVTIFLSHLYSILMVNFGLEKSVSFVLQPVSAFEKPGIDELASQSVDMLNGISLKKNVFKDQIAFNLLPCIEPVKEDGFSPMEKQIYQEIKRVLASPDLSFSLSIIQAPIFHTYSIMSYVNLKKKTDIKSVEDIFKRSSYFKVVSPTSSSQVSSASYAGKDEIIIGLVKKEESSPNSFWIWMVADNLTRGSALNAFEIAKKIVSQSKP